MTKRVYIDGKPVKFSDLTETQMQLEVLLKQEKQAMAALYNRISTSGLSPEEKAAFEGRFNDLSVRIKSLQAGDTAEWFCGLTEE